MADLNGLSVSVPYRLIAQGFHGDSVMDLILGAGPVSQLVLLVLAFFSIVSWAIMADRYRAIGRAEREDVELIQVFRSRSSLADLRDFCEGLPYSPMAHVYRAGFREMARVTTAAQTESVGGVAVASRTKSTSAEATARMLERAMTAASSEAQGRLERFLGFLASTASATPFIGLFGTVWGIMNAFQAIGMIGTANLASVAPGISEALIATAAGLGAAIPAVLGYNYFNNRLRGVGNRLDSFIGEVLNRFERAV